MDFKELEVTINDLVKAGIENQEKYREDIEVFTYYCNYLHSLQQSHLFLRRIIKEQEATNA